MLRRRAGRITTVCPSSSCTAALHRYAPTAVGGAAAYLQPGRTLLGHRFQGCRTLLSLPPGRDGVPELGQYVRFQDLMKGPVALVPGGAQPGGEVRQLLQGGAGRLPERLLASVLPALALPRRLLSVQATVLVLVGEEEVAAAPGVLPDGQMSEPDRRVFLRPSRPFTGSSRPKRSIQQHRTAPHRLLDGLPDRVALIQAPLGQGVQDVHLQLTTPGVSPGPAALYLLGPRAALPRTRETGSRPKKSLPCMGWAVNAWGHWASSFLLNRSSQAYASFSV